MLARRFYISMLAVGAAGALFALGIMFGVGVVTAPPERTANAPAGRLATPDGVRRNPVQIGADRTLTPVYPANPGSGENASTDKPPTVPAGETAAVGGGATTGMAADESKQVKPVNDASAQPAAPADTTDASARVEAESKPGIHTMTLRTADRCDVAACSAAYRSFRASDCTYQPYDGPRQLCENPPRVPVTGAAAPAQREPARERASPRERDDDAELRAAVEAVKELTGPPSASRDLVPFAERGRGRARLACNVAACAQAYDSFNASDCTFQPYTGPRQVCTR